MANETKGITVKIDAGLHAQVREYVESHGMTMAEFVSQALDNELHPKYQLQEASTMANTRTIAFQVPEDLYQRIKDYLSRNNMTQKQFFLDLIETELEREQAEREAVRENEPEAEAHEETADGPAQEYPEENVSEADGEVSAGQADEESAEPTEGFELAM